MSIKNIIIIAILFSMTSCSGYKYSALYNNHFNENEQIEIKNKGACCGCLILIANQFLDNKIKEQFVFETKCNLYEPTKHFFKTDKKGRVLQVDSYIATTDNDFDMPISENDKIVFTILDSIYQSNRSRNELEINYLAIKGYKHGNKIHFPVGIKMSKKKFQKRR